MTNCTRVALVAIALTAFPTGAAAATKIITKTVVQQSNGTPSTELATLLIDGRRMRVDASAGRSTVLFDAEAGTAWLLDHRDKTYVKVDRGTTQAVGQAIDQASATLRASLEGLPPDQRAAMEQLLGGQIPKKPAQKEKISVHETGETAQVSGVSCQEVEVRKASERIATMCRAAFADAGVDEATFAVMTDLASFLQESVDSLVPGGMKKLNDQGIEAIQSFGDLDGVPMRIRSFEGERQISETLVQEIGSTTTDAASFSVPQGYRGGFSISDIDALRGKK